MKHFSIKKNLALVMAVAICVSTVLSVQFPTSAETLSQMFKPDEEPVEFSYEKKDSYKDVLKQFSENGYKSAKNDKITIPASRFFIDGKYELLDEYKGEKSVFYWDENTENIVINVTIPSDGLYTFGFTYNSGTKESAPIVRSLTIDGLVPYEDCYTLGFNRKWICDGKVIKNTAGDEVKPKSEQSDDWQTSEFEDYTGENFKPYQLYLTSGNHSFDFKFVSMNVYISSFFLSSFEEPMPYKEILKIYKQKGYKSSNEKIMFEAEKALKYSSSSTMRVGSDGDPSCTPISRGYTVMNVVGSDCNTAGVSSEYRFWVKKSGLYKLVTRTLNNTRDGLPSFRKIEIDGKIPFAEVAEYKFLDTDKWDMVTIGESKDKPYLFYLEKGEHTLTFTSLQSDFSVINDILEESSTKLSNLILQINMIVGDDPDYNYDYHLDTQIPELIPTMDLLIDNMEKAKKIILQISEKDTAKYNELENFISQIEKMKSNVFKIPRKMKDFETLLSQYGTWISQFALSPLVFDNFVFAPEKSIIENKKTTFFGSLYSTCVSFIVSFSKDYSGVATTAGDVKIKDTIDVWVSRGTVWGNMTKSLIDSSFTPNSGIAAKINIVPAGQLNAGAVNTLMLAIASGRAPDVCLGVSTASVGEFAIRNAIKDVSKMSGYKELSKNFLPTMLIPNSYKEKVYGIPETMNFKCIVYRKDILSDIGASIPKTWDDVRNELFPILKQNNMEMYIPVNVGSDLYATFLYQNDGNFYTDDLERCTFNTELSYKVFSEAVDFVKVYSVPITMNFYNRFRTGDAPIGIADMTSYMQIMCAAPEIRGKWGIAPIPGTVSENGKINRSYASGSETSVVLINNKGKKDKSKLGWEFIKWWMSYETQVDYGYSIEAEQGTAARWNSANKDAFYAMAWDRDDLAVIKECQKQIDARPVVFGGYYLDRYINNAYNAVAISGKNMREQIEDAAQTIDAELERRRR